MITMPCVMLFCDRAEARVLVGFNDPARGLTPNDPCYLPIYAVRCEPADTGEILADEPLALANALITLPDNLWEACPNLVARELEAARRAANAERAEEERRRKRSASAQRREHDQQIRASQRRKSRNPDQGTLW